MTRLSGAPHRRRRTAQASGGLRARPRSGGPCWVLAAPVDGLCLLVVVVLIPTDPPAPSLQKLFQSTELALGGLGPLKPGLGDFS